MLWHRHELSICFKIKAKHIHTKLPGFRGDSGGSVEENKCLFYIKKNKLSQLQSCVVRNECHSVKPVSMVLQWKAWALTTVAWFQGCVAVLLHEYESKCFSVSYFVQWLCYKSQHFQPLPNFDSRSVLNLVSWFSFFTWYQCVAVHCQFTLSDTSINTLTYLPSPYHRFPACPALAATVWLLLLLLVSKQRLSLTH